MTNDDTDIVNDENFEKQKQFSQEQRQISVVSCHNLEKDSVNEIVTNSNDSSTDRNNETVSTFLKKDATRGLPKSRRFWKPVETSRASAIKKSIKKKTWTKKAIEREEQKAVKLQHELLRTEKERQEKVWVSIEVFFFFLWGYSLFMCFITLIFSELFHFHYILGIFCSVLAPEKKKQKKKL